MVMILSLRTGACEKAWFALKAARRADAQTALNEIVFTLKLGG